MFLSLWTLVQSCVLILLMYYKIMVSMVTAVLCYACLLWMLVAVVTAVALQYLIDAQVRIATLRSI